MKIAVTGGSGFVGGHAARALLANGDQVVLIGRRAPGWLARRQPGLRWVGAQIDDETALAQAFAGCDAVLHCAGINLERGSQTFARVHVQGTASVVRAAQQAGVHHLTLVSFLRARPACGSAYHESTWAAEELVRTSGLEYTILKPGVIHGRGDHMLDHLSRSLGTFPVFPLVGLKTRAVQPVSVDDVARILVASAHDHRLAGLTVPVLGPEQLSLREAVERVGGVIGRRPLYIALPVPAHRVAAWCLERVMTIPLVSQAQVQILAEGVVEPVLAGDRLPADLQPATPFSDDAIVRGLPPQTRFGWQHLRLCGRAA